MLYLACQWANKARCVLPTAPADLNINVSGDNMLRLTWTAGLGATSYNIKRSLVPGGPYTTIGTSAVTTYDDHTVANYTMYYYVVSSTNACGESAVNSIESHGTPFNFVVSGWINRVQVNGGLVPSLNTVKSLDTFVHSLVTCGIDGLMIAVNAFVPDSLIAALTPLYVGPGSDPWTNHNFVAGDLTINGLKGDAVGKYLQTGIVPANVYGAINSGMSIYCPETYNAASFGYDMESSDAAITSKSGINFLPAANISNWACFDTGSQVTTANPGPFVGFLSGNRIAANNTSIYKASSTVPFFAAGSNALSGGNLALITNDLYVFAANFGFAFGYVSHRLSFAAMHAGLTAVQDRCLFNAVQALRVALGGGFA